MKREALRRLARVWIALLVLLALTCASAYVPMGAWNTVANFAIALAKAALVAVFFMHLARRPAHRVVAAGALFVLALLLTLTLTDYLTRVRYPAPWQVPQGAISAS